MNDWSAVAGAAMFVAGGLVAVIIRLGGEFDRSVCILTIALTAGASQLSRVVWRGEVSEAAAFAIAAVLVYAASLFKTRLAGVAMLSGLALLAPLFAPEETPSPTVFAAGNGFLALTPVLYIALVATLLRARAQVAEAAAALIALTLWPLVHTTLVPVVALLTPGLGAAVDWAKRRPVAALAPLVVLAIAWNYWLMVQYTIGMIPKDAPFSFATMVRQQADVHTRAPYVYPFAFPGNLVAAWREGLPVARYDELSVEPRRNSFEIRFDRSGDRFLLDGWGSAGTGATGPFRTVSEAHATLVFPIAPSDQHVDVLVIATLRGADPTPVDGAVQINGAHVGAFTVPAGPATEARFTVRRDDVGRVFRTGYNRLSIVSSAPRRLAIHRVRIAPST